MRLINCKTFQLEEFFDTVLPQYAILSHRWEKDEVTFQDVEQSVKDAQHKAGFEKIRHCCEQTLKDGFDYCWVGEEIAAPCWPAYDFQVDTCCINKASSSELSESINSMFRYYQDAGICYAYLSDVVLGPEPGPWDSYKADFRKSPWWNRGWTLQELIAPTHVVFYGKDWCTIGNKRQIAHRISRITAIPGSVLTRPGATFERSIAERMSWAAKRTTTRKEDIAYCLLGIMQVNMPLLYGEGDRAFERLQLEIIKASDDKSIFAWRTNENEQIGIEREEQGVIFKFCGPLAPSPRAFAHSAGIVPANPDQLRKGLWNDRKSYQITNAGLSIHALLSPWWTSRIFLWHTGCIFVDEGVEVVLFLFRPSTSQEYARIHSNVFLRDFKRIPRMEDLTFGTTDPTLSRSIRLSPLRRQALQPKENPIYIRSDIICPKRPTCAPSACPRDEIYIHVRSPTCVGLGPKPRVTLYQWPEYGSTLDETRCGIIHLTMDPLVPCMVLQYELRGQLLLLVVLGCSAQLRPWCQIIPGRKSLEGDSSRLRKYPTQVEEILLGTGESLKSDLSPQQASAVRGTGPDTPFEGFEWFGVHLQEVDQISERESARVWAVHQQFCALDRRLTPVLGERHGARARAETSTDTPERECSGFPFTSNPSLVQGSKEPLEESTKMISHPQHAHPIEEPSPAIPGSLDLTTVPVIQIHSEG